MALAVHPKIRGTKAVWLTAAAERVGAGVLMVGGVGGKEARERGAM
jgi:hypothetical protein